MASYSDNVFDSGLDYLSTNVDDLHICSQEPATYTEATSTYTLGDKQTITVSAAADRTGGGREVTISAFTDGDVTATGTASHYALVYTTGTELCVTGALASSQAVTSGNTFEISAFAAGFQDPA